MISVSHTDIPYQLSLFMVKHGYKLYIQIFQVLSKIIFSHKEKPVIHIVK